MGDEMERALVDFAQAVGVTSEELGLSRPPPTLEEVSLDALRRYEEFRASPEHARVRALLVNEPMLTHLRRLSPRQNAQDSLCAAFAGVPVLHDPSLEGVAARAVVLRDFARAVGVDLPRRRPPFQSVAITMGLRRCRRGRWWGPK